MIVELPERIATGVESWISYEISAARSALLSEASLAHPLGQILLANKSNPDALVAEYAHPLLKVEGKGRPPQLDFVITKRPYGFDPDKPVSLELAVESKWFGGARQSAPKFEALLFDILRLRMLTADLGLNTNSRLFVVAGTWDKYHQLTARGTNQGGGRNRSNGLDIILPTELSTESSFSLLETRDRVLQKWLIEAAKKGIEVPQSYKALLAAKSEKSGYGFCFVWIIRRVPNADKTFDPRNEW